MAALRFDPPALDFGTALVATQTVREVTVENVSDAALGYTIDAVMFEDVVSRRRAI